MARYTKEHKQVTRQRIIERAGHRFKQDGIDGSGISTLMSDAGLTNGAFYSHFASKDDLVAQVIEDQLERQAQYFDQLLAQPSGLERLLSEYLSAQQRDDRALGCPSVALLDEISRTSAAGRHAYTVGATKIIEHLADHLVMRGLTEGGAATARAKAIALFGLLVGTMQLARAVDDQELSDEVLASALEQARALIR
ncbi:MAG: TetR/AcrR family transcriptional regulator [Mycetocola sp.]